MRSRNVVLAFILAAAALSAGAQPRTESGTGPFTYEALGATPSLSFGGAKGVKSAAAKQDVQAPGAADRTARAAPSATFTYDTLGATPHVERKKRAAAEAHAPQGSAR